MQGLTALTERWLEALGPNPYLQAVAVLVFILVLAKLADVTARFVVRRLVRRWAGPAVERLVAVLSRPVFVTVILMGLMVTASLIIQSPGPARVTRALLQTILTIVWISVLMRFSTVLLEVLGRREPPVTIAQPTTAPLLRTLAFIVLALAGAYTVLVVWDISVTGVVASAGIVGLALSFAAQDTLANLFAGIAILSDRPYRIGDYIVLDTGERGAVTHIGLRSTRLLTRDDVEVSIPNSVMGQAKIVNESGGPYSRYRVRVPVPIAYGSDLDVVMQVLLTAASAHPQVCRTPEPRVRFRNFGEVGLQFELLCWIEDPAQRGLVQHEINCELYRIFNERGIRIGWPRREVQITNS